MACYVLGFISNTSNVDSLLTRRCIQNSKQNCIVLLSFNTKLKRKYLIVPRIRRASAPVCGFLVCLKYGSKSQELFVGKVGLRGKHLPNSP